MLKNKKIGIIGLSITLLTSSAPALLAQVRVAPPVYPGYGFPYNRGFGGGPGGFQRRPNFRRQNNFRRFNPAFNKPPVKTKQPFSPPFQFVSDSNVNPAPAIGTGSALYVVDGSNTLYALDQKTGKVLWTFHTGGDMTASPTVGPNGTVYVGSYDQNVYALNGKTGAKKWQFTTPKLVGTTPAVGANGMIYVGGYDSMVYALNKSGAKQWQYAAGSPVSSPIVGPHGTVYAGADKVYALNGTTGKLKWAFPNGYVGNDTPLLDAKTDRLFVGAHDGTLYDLSAKTGREVWHLPTNGTINSAPVLGTDGSLYFASSRLYRLAPRNGKIDWQLDRNGKEWVSPVIGAKGTLYAGCADQNVYAIDPISGQVRWHFSVADGLSSAPTLGPDHQVYLTDNGAGEVYCISGLTGLLIWQSVLPKPPASPK